MVSRDTILWLGGLLILGKQAGIGFAPPDQVSGLLVGAGLMMANVPGVLQLLPALLGREGPTPSEPSPSPPSSPSVTPPGGPSVGEA
jgi:hypothetical protein